MFLISFGDAVFGDDKPPAAGCSAFDPGGKLGTNLVLAPDGTLYNVSDDQRLQALVPSALADAAAKPTLTLTEELLRTNPGALFRVSGKIETAPNLTLGVGASVILVAGEGIAFKPGFRVDQGARLRARVGLGN